MANGPRLKDMLDKLLNKEVRAEIDNPEATLVCILESINDNPFTDLTQGPCQGTMVNEELLGLIRTFDLKGRTARGIFVEYASLVNPTSFGLEAYDNGRYLMLPEESTVLDQAIALM